MNTDKVNLFIVDDNTSMVTALKHFLENKFGNNISISTFSSGESCLMHLNAKTNIVILDYLLPGKNGLAILKSIKKTNPKTEVIMLSNNEDMAQVIESYRKGASAYITKEPGSWRKITRFVTHVITAPIRILTREFKVSKFVAIFLMTFLTMGVVVIISILMRR